jgi:hypothetical protein
MNMIGLRLLKARILLKADSWEAGEGWGDNRIIGSRSPIATPPFAMQRFCQLP